MTFAYDSGNADPDVKARDALAGIVIQRYRSSVNWQGTELIGGRPLSRVLRECYDQANGILSPEDREVAELLKVNAYVNLTAMKTGVVQAFLRESLVAADELPWRLEPTPIPDLSEAGADRCLGRVKERLYGEGFQGNLEDLVRETADEVYLEEQEEARRAATNMTRLIFDQTVEGGWRTALSAFLHDFVTYPYGIIQGPVPVRGPRLAWRGSRPVPRQEVYYRWEAVSPWDFWYSPDSPDTQRGTGISLRKRYTRRHLMEMARMKSYYREQVLDLLKETDTKSQYNFKWMSRNPDQPDDQLVHWLDCTDTVEALQHYGRFSGRELGDWGVSGLDSSEYYDACVTVIGGYTVQVHADRNPAGLARPVFTASFYRHRDRIPNYGIAQIVRDVERAYLASLRYLMRNVANASEPIMEVDYTRLIKHMQKEDIATFTPGAVFLAEGDISGSGAPAVRPFLIPSNIGDYVRVMEFFIDLADKITNVPAALHGTAVGTGANRTFRGMATLQSNAVKAIQAAVSNLDEGVFLPMGELLFRLNMIYGDDPSVRGDCKVYPQGVDGLLAKEIQASKALELLEAFGAFGNQMGDTINPVVDWAVRQLVVSMGVPRELAAGIRMGGGTPQGAGPPIPGSAPTGAGPMPVPPGPGDMPSMTGMPPAGPDAVPPEVVAAALQGAGVMPGMPPGMPMPGMPMPVPAGPDGLPPFPDRPLPA